MQLTTNLAYLIGSLRDGSVSRFVDKLGKVHHSITFYSKSLGWLRIISQKFEPTFGIKTKISFYNTKTLKVPYLRVYSKKIAEIMLHEFQHPLGRQIRWHTPIKIRHADKEIQRHFIAGFWDAEGGAELRNKQISFYLSWDGDECPPLEDLKQMLLQLGIRSGRVCRYENENGVYPRFVLRVSKYDNQKFVEEIPVQNPEKRNKLNLLSGAGPQNSLPAEGLCPEDGRD